MSEADDQYLEESCIFVCKLTDAVTVDECPHINVRVAFVGAIPKSRIYRYSYHRHRCSFKTASSKTSDKPAAHRMARESRDPL